MKLIDIIQDSTKYLDRYDLEDALKITIHKNLGKLVLKSDLLKNIPELDLGIDALLELYKNSDKDYGSL